MTLESAIALLGFGVAMFSIGYTIGKDLNTRKNRP